MDNLNRIRLMVKQEVKKTGASCISISENAGYNKSVLSKFLSGHSSIKLKTLLDILDTIGINIYFEEN